MYIIYVHACLFLSLENNVNILDEILLSAMEQRNEQKYVHNWYF